MTPEELGQRLKQQPFSSEREQLMGKILLVALRNSQRVTPVRTGLLRRTETTRIAAQGAEGYLGSNLVYAPFAHARVPFFEQGIADSRPQIDQQLQKAGDTYLAKVVKG